MSSPITTTTPSLAVPTPPKPFVDLTNVSFVLFIWDILIGLPISYLLTTIIGAVLRNENVVLSRMLFVGLNLALVSAWAIQLTEQQENDNLEREIRWWDREIEILEGLLEEIKQREKGGEFTEEKDGDAEETEESIRERVIDDTEESDESALEEISTDLIKESETSFAF